MTTINLTKLLALSKVERPVGTTGDWGVRVDSDEDRTAGRGSYAFELELPCFAALSYRSAK